MSSVLTTVIVFLALSLSTIRTFSAPLCIELFTERAKVRTNNLSTNEIIEVVEQLAEFGWDRGMAKRIAVRYPDLAKAMVTNPQGGGEYYLTYRGLKGSWESYNPDYVPSGTAIPPIRKKHSWAEYQEKRWKYLRRFRFPGLSNNTLLYTYTSPTIPTAQSYADGGMRFRSPWISKPGYILELRLPAIIVGWENGPMFLNAPVVDWHTIPDLTPFIHRVRLVTPDDNPNIDIQPDDPKWKTFEEVAPLNDKTR